MFRVDEIGEWIQILFNSATSNDLLGKASNSHYLSPHISRDSPFRCTYRVLTGPNKNLGQIRPRFSILWESVLILKTRAGVHITKEKQVSFFFLLSPRRTTPVVFCEQVSFIYFSFPSLLFPYLLYRCLNTTCCHVFEKFITGGSVDLLHCSREYEHGVDQRKLGTISYLHPANNNGWAWDQSRGKHGSFGR